jgi:hypothetical protein
MSKKVRIIRGKKREKATNVITEALLGLSDICSKNPGLLISSLGQVVNGLLKLFIDEVS